MVVGVMRRIVLPLGLFAAVLAVWQYGSAWAHISPKLLASPSDVLRAIDDTLPLLLQHAVPTAIAYVASFVLASILGFVLGTALAASRRLRQAIYPHIVLFQLTPKIAVAPLFIIWLGVGAASTLAMAVLLSFFPVLIATVSGITGTDAGSLRLCRALTATRWQTFRYVRLPYALPHIFDGLKIAATISLTGLIVGEFVAAQAGLGYVVLFASSIGETSLLLAAVAFLCLIGLVLYGLVAGAERLVMRSFGGSSSAEDHAV
jgi:NitT/TauT family transport system permease protein